MAQVTYMTIEASRKWKTKESITAEKAFAILREELAAALGEVVDLSVFDETKQSFQIQEGKARAVLNLRAKLNHDYEGPLKIVLDDDWEFEGDEDEDQDEDEDDDSDDDWDDE